jgi:hypothetical protein
VSRLDRNWIGGGSGCLVISARQGWVDLDRETSVSVPSRGLDGMRVSEVLDGNVRGEFVLVCPSGSRSVITVR